MRKLIVAASVMLGLLLAVNVFSQDASLSGIVTDTSKAVIPGATVTATNDNTGVVSTLIANDSGAYTFPKLPFGTYTVKAELDGFQTKTFTNVALQVGQQARLNFELEVAGVSTEIEVSTSAADILLESSSSVGDVLAAQTVMELPQVGRDALDLIKVMSGVVMADDPNNVYTRNDTSFAGVQATGVNIQRDGVTVNDVRFPTGINAATRVNPDMVGDVTMAGQEYFKQAVAGVMFVSQVFRYQATSKPVFAIAGPVSKGQDGAVEGVLCALVDMAQFNKIFIDIIFVKPVYTPSEVEILIDIFTPFVTDNKSCIGCAGSKSTELNCCGSRLSKRIIRKCKDD